MKALAKFGKPSEFGTYHFIDVPEPTCGDDDVIIEIKAAAICGADMKHFNVDNGSEEFGSVRGHEFSGEIVEVGKDVTAWKVGQRVVSDNTGHVCGKCPACMRGDFLLCSEHVNLGLGYGYSGGFTKYCKIPGEILRIHPQALWEIPENVSYEEAAVLDPISNAYKALAQQSSLLPGENAVIFGTGPLGLFAVQIAKLMGLQLNKTDSEYRDMFLLIIYLVGINMKDLANLTPANYIDGRIEYRRAKTGKLYSIKVEPEAAEIIERYKGKKHLLSPFDRYKSHTNYLIHLNEGLRRIGPIEVDANGKPKYTKNHLPIMKPIEKEITSYWGRYSWATYAADLDIPKDTISEALGHVHGSKITGVYIKFSRDKIDEANRKVIDYVLGKANRPG